MWYNIYNADDGDAPFFSFLLKNTESVEEFSKFVLDKLRKYDIDDWREDSYYLTLAFTIPKSQHKPDTFFEDISEIFKYINMHNILDECNNRDNYSIISTEMLSGILKKIDIKWDYRNDKYVISTYNVKFEMI